MRLSYQLGIRSKLILVVTLIIVIAIGGVVVIATDLYMDESITKVQEANQEAAKFTSEKLFNTMQEVSRQMTVMAQTVTNNPEDQEQIDSSIKTVMGSFDGVMSFYAYYIDDKGQVNLKYSFISQTALGEYTLTAKQLTELPFALIRDAQFAKPEEFIFHNSSHILNRPVYSLSFMSKTDLVNASNPITNRWLFRAEIREDLLLAAFLNSKDITSYVVDQAGSLVAHSDPFWMKQVYKGIDYKQNPIVSKMLQGVMVSQQMEFNWNDITLLGTYHRIGIGGLSVVTHVPKQIAIATIEQVQYRSLLVMVIVLCFAFLFNFVFSNTLTKPLQTLYTATEQIVAGNYDVHLQRNSQDEIGALSLAFSDMAKGLREKEKLKTVFGKFHSKEVAKKLLAGEIKLGGEKKLATVFFSDLRDFTSMSESLSADQVVLLLNEYMSEMVKIIHKWNGVVDKYIGDAIMAVWGAPETNPRDAYNAVRAALEMREFMLAFNATKKAKRMQELQIGIGLHTGEVLAGNIGSEQRLEYTVIGDTVNQASRIEGANKIIGSDILISHATYLLVKDAGVVVGPELQIQVKGKTQSLKVYQVIGYQDAKNVFQSVLSEERKNSILAQNTQHTAKNEDKATLAVPAVDFPPLPAEVEQKTNIVPLAAANDNMLFYIMPDMKTRQTFGPFSDEEIRLKISQGYWTLEESFILKEGEVNWQPLFEWQKFNRRKEEPSSAIEVTAISEDIKRSSFSNEWYIYAPQGQNLGPYSLEQLDSMLKAGHIQRTTYVWQTGYENWIYLYEVPNFNRRTA